MCSAVTGLLAKPVHDIMAKQLSNTNLLAATGVNWRLIID
jgi:hypothetical protein